MWLRRCDRWKQQVLVTPHHFVTKTLKGIYIYIYIYIVLDNGPRSLSDGWLIWPQAGCRYFHQNGRTEGGCYIIPQSHYACVRFRALSDWSLTILVTKRFQLLNQKPCDQSTWDRELTGRTLSGWYLHITLSILNEAVQYSVFGGKCLEVPNCI